MPLNKSKGNMYSWVTHTHAHLGGECPHKCSYCYVNNPRFGRPKKFQGPIRLLEDEFKVKYGYGRTIFMENCNDLFAEDVPDSWIKRVIDHAREWPGNIYVWQTKNPLRYLSVGRLIPLNSILGCTIETNRDIPKKTSKAPQPRSRVIPMVHAGAHGNRIFITIEPVMDFDVDILADWIARIRPEFVNIGADSKRHDLPEPSREKVIALIECLQKYGIDIREKHNLERIIGK